MFNISGQNVNFGPSGPKTDTRFCTPYLHSP